MTQSASPLQHVAATMKRVAQTNPTGHAFRVVNQGLAVVYGHRDNRWRLAIGRQAPNQPSPEEMEFMAAAFDAPMDFAPVYRKATWWDPIEESQRTYNVLEITWREVEPAADLAKNTAELMEA